jgi:hypothetical protein
MLPFLFLIVIARKKLVASLVEMKKHPLQWLLWGTVGFGPFYATICFAGAYRLGWIIAATWQSQSYLVHFSFLYFMKKSKLQMDQYS